jgi:methylthioribose-1-phosphate isomerase
VATAAGQVTVQPLRFEDGALLVLDQRALPAEERWIPCDTVEQVAEAIRSMAVRGAPAIGLAAAYGMALAEDREKAATLLRGTRPTAVNLAWAVERCLAADDALTEARRLHREQDAADRRLAELGAERFEEGDRALTHCNTGALATGGYGTAGGVLRAAWDRGRLAEVWVDETRPLLQGARLTAWELRRAGIPFRVIADSAAGGLMARGLVDRVVVGADRIAANGDVANKVGTYPLAVLAARHGVPFYVAAPISTIDPRTPSGDRIPIEERDPAELGSTPVAFNGTKRSTSGRFFGFRGATRAGTTTTSQAAPSTSSRARSRNTCCVLRSPRAARGIRPAPRSGSRRRTSSHHLRGARAWS